MAYHLPPLFTLSRQALKLFQEGNEYPLHLNRSLSSNAGAFSFPPLVDIIK